MTIGQQGLLNESFNADVYESADLHYSRFFSERHKLSLMKEDQCKSSDDCHFAQFYNVDTLIVDMIWKWHAHEEVKSILDQKSQMIWRKRRILAVINTKLPQM